MVSVSPWKAVEGLGETQLKSEGVETSWNVWKG